MEIVLAADEAANAAKGWSDYMSALGPIAVLSGAIITAWVAIRNARKSAHDRLETLVKVAKDWPDGVDGIDTVNHSMLVALAEIRRKEKHPKPVTVSEEQREAERDSVKSRFRSYTSMAAVVVGLATAGVMVVQSAGAWSELAQTPWTEYLAAGGTILASLAALNGVWRAIALQKISATAIEIEDRKGNPPPD